MQEYSLPAKIKSLIGQLEEELCKLSFSHEAELNLQRENHVNELTNLKGELERRLTIANDEYRSRIITLEGEVSYLKELNFSQRVMMEDNLVYTRSLETKLDISALLFIFFQWSQLQIDFTAHLYRKYKAAW